MLGRVLLLAFGILAITNEVIGKNIAYKKCTETGGELESLDVQPCDTEPCAFYKDSNVTCIITFTPNEDVTTSTIKMYGEISGIPIPFPLHNSDGCKDHGLKCPLKKGVQVQLNLAVFIQDEYPEIKVVVKLEMESQSGKMDFCGEFPAHIAKKTKNAEELEDEKHTVVV